MKEEGGKMKKQIAWLLFLLSPSSFLLAQPPGAVQPEQIRGDMTAGLVVHVEDVEAHLVRLTLTVTGGPLLQVEPPQLADSLDAWEAARNEWCRLDASRLTWTTTIQLRQTKPGSVSLPDLKVRFRAGPDAAWQQAEWVDLLKGRGAPPPEFLPPPSSPMQWLPWTTAVVALLGLVGIGCWIGRRRRPMQQPSPEQRALQELGRLDASAPTDPAAYHTALSEVMRRYLADRFSLPATQRTTAEFLVTIGRSGRLPAEQQALLRDFLERCDLAKFAPVGASAEDRRETAGLARALVEQTSGTKTAKLPR
jgi:uncharacterized protein DUF4381